MKITKKWESIGRISIEIQLETLFSTGINIDLFFARLNLSDVYNAKKCNQLTDFIIVIILESYFSLEIKQYLFDTLSIKVSLIYT